jgi:hypothetical protein
VLDQVVEVRLGRHRLAGRGHPLAQLIHSAGDREPLPLAVDDPPGGVDLVAERAVEQEIPADEDAQGEEDPELQRMPELLPEGVELGYIGRPPRATPPTSSPPIRRDCRC